MVLGHNNIETHNIFIVLNEDTSTDEIQKKSEVTRKHTLNCENFLLSSYFDRIFSNKYARNGKNKWELNWYGQLW